MSLLTEVFNDMNKLNNNNNNNNNDRNLPQIKTREDKGKEFKGFTYDPNDITTDYRSSQDFSDNNNIRNEEQVHPSLKTTGSSNNGEMEELRKNFRYAFDNCPEIENKYAGTLESVLNDPDVMQNAVLYYNDYIQQQANKVNDTKIEEQKEQKEHYTDINYEEEDYNKSPWLLIFYDIIYPLIMAVIYFILGSKQVQLYLNDLLPIINNYYTFKLFTMTIIFFILAVISKKIASVLID